MNRTETNFVWNGGNLAEEYGGSNGIYTYDGQGIHISNQDGVVKTYLKDQHTNIVGYADEDGELIDTGVFGMDYDAFGNQWTGENPDPFGYCGEYLDKETGLIYLRNRYYDSSTGRFITEDPAQDGLNWYSYCAGDPVNAVDPWGLGFTLNNYNENGDDRLAALQALTDDTLSYDTNTDRVIIVNEVDDPTRENGTNLIRELIASPIVCTIDYTTDNNSYMNPTYDLNGNLVSGEILYNPSVNFDILVETENGTQIVQETNYIVMGHELVHFYNRLQGNKDNMPNANGNYVDPSNGYSYRGGVYYYQDENGIWQSDMNKIEELRATGIVSYVFWTDSNGKQQVYSEFPGKYSENSLRQEQSQPMPIRVKY